MKIKTKIISVEKETFSAYLIYIDGDALVGRCVQPFWISKNQCQLVRGRGENGERYALIPDWILKKEAGFEFEKTGNIFNKTEFVTRETVTKGGRYDTRSRTRRI